MRSAHYLALSFLALLGVACSSEETGASSSTNPPPYTPDFIQISYEAMPGAGFMVDYSNDPYEERAEFTDKVKADVVPETFAAAGEDFSKLETDSVPGGYLLAVNPSLQTRVAEDWDATTKTAAALGFVMYQWSVLITDFTPSDAGNTGYGVVTFPAGALDTKMAGDFFTHASTVDDGLGGGFFAFGDSMYFLNIADSMGMPYSGLADDAFVMALKTAAEGFSGAKAELSKSGKCDSRFVENDWDGKPMGDDYLAKFDQAGKDKLTALQTEFKGLFEGAVTQYGWDMDMPMPKKAPAQRRGFYGYRFGGPASK